ncbi:MAG TPA: peptidase U32 [Firmicutes bacterium]|nr:peptidase U32 [Bacillota bacterium]
MKFEENWIEVYLMTRFFNGRETELLAPAGTFEDFKAILHSGADAFYMGGKKFNMRMHRKEHNFTNEELEQAVKMAHEVGKKVYITFNNMMSNEELTEAHEYLLFLESIQPDALIIQDFGAVKYIKDNNINLNMHLSVMANVHNVAMIKAAQKLGVTRVVTSREMSLEDISKFVSTVPEMEYEYFIHGDMCVAHGAQCTMSGMMFGKSGSRGRCMKPCRWAFKEGEDSLNHPMAVKDMTLYDYIPELMMSGVNSFKIEGRMRNHEYLVTIINNYRFAIDRFIEDPTGYMTNSKASQYMQDSRVRNLSTAYAFGKPGASNIDITGSREPRVFSKPIEELEINKERIDRAKAILKKTTKPKLAVKVNNVEAFKQACDNGADLLYLAGEVYKPDVPFKKQDIRECVEYAVGKKVYYVLPRMSYERQMLELSFLVPELKSLGVAGVVVGNLGEIHEFYHDGLEFRGDYNLNVYNTTSAQFYADLGLSTVTLSIEATADVMKNVLTQSNVAMEVIAHGAPDMMYMEHCLMCAADGQDSIIDCDKQCLKGAFVMEDENGFKHTVYADQYCKNHLISTKDHCLMPILKEVNDLGVDTFRIEAGHYTPSVVGEVVAIYRKAIDEIELDLCKRETNQRLRDITSRGISLHALNY